MLALTSGKQHDNVGNIAPYHGTIATEPPMRERVTSQFPGTGCCT
jgi:hypothetical protein